MMRFKKWIKEMLARFLEERLGMQRKAYIAAEVKKQFKNFGRHSKLMEPIAYVLNPQYIEIGDGVKIHPYARLIACNHYPATGQEFSPRIIIGDGTRLGWFFSVQSNCEVVIEKNVLIASYVAITDLYHHYEDVNLPIMEQLMTEGKRVRIGEGTYVGNNVNILPNVNIGKHCVIGMGSVVTKDIPDYSVAVGNPARVIKQYCFEEKKWKRVANVQHR